MSFNLNKVFRGNPFQFIGIILSGLVGLYILLRGYYVPPFCDEVFSFFFYIRPGDMQPFYAHLDANNHVINSALSRLFYLAFGGEIFVLRLANILVFALYVWYLFRFRSMFQNSLVWLAFLASMIVPQYFIDFFHLSRGYGLSMAFLVGTIYHLLSYHSSSELKHFLLGLGFLSVTVWSNLSTTLTAAFIGTCFLLSWLGFGFRSSSTTKNLVHGLGFIILFCLPLGYAVKYGFALQDAGMLYYGVDNDFWKNSVVEPAQLLTNNWQVASWAMILIPTMVITLFFINWKKRGMNETIFIHIALWGSVAGILILHHVMGVKYPLDRSVLHLFLLLFVALFIEIDRSEWNALKVGGSGLAISLLLLTISGLNLTHTRLWAIEHVPEKYYDAMLRWKGEKGVIPTVTAQELHLRVLRYYDFLNNGALGIIHNPPYPGKHYDFVVIRENINLSDQGFDTLYYQPAHQSGLLVRKENPINWSLKETVTISEMMQNTEYMSLGYFDVSQLRGNAVSVQTQFWVSSPVEMKDLQLIYVIKDIDGKNLDYQELSLDENHPHLNNGRLIESRNLFESVPESANVFQVFIWNVKQEPLRLTRAETKFFVATVEK